MSDLHWLAGLLEGEGTFGVQTVDGKPYAYARLVMTDLDVVERAAALFPTTGSIVVVPSRKEGWQQSYSVNWSHRKAIDVMWAVLPYMGARRTAKIVDTLADCYENRFKLCKRCQTSFFVQWNTNLNSLFCGENCRGKAIRDRRREARNGHPV